jgi:hypothetical protein
LWARKCQLKTIDKRIAFDFFKQHHIQGQGQAVACYGLYHDNHLMAAMSFSKLNRAKGYSHQEGIYELNRYCSIGNIAGGASRLFNKFIKEYKPETVLTYSDLRWNTGDMYTNIGFEHVGDTAPGYWYVSGDKRIHRYKLRKRPEEPKDVTEYELRLSEGYHRIWDCGHAKFVWTKKPV